MNRTPRILPALAFLVLASAATACQAHLVVAPAAPNPARPRPPAALSRAVIVVSIDGLRPDAIAAYQAAAIGRLIVGGSSTLSARTIVPSKTLPSHTSMVTGESPDDHGVRWNNAFTHRSTTLSIPTIFSKARSRGYTTAAFFSKTKFSHLQQPGALDYSQAPGGWFGLWPAARTVQDVETYLAGHAPNLLFVHLADPDTAGHKSGWMSARYGKAVVEADAAVARLLVAADRAYGTGLFTIIITADHGGHGRGHGSADARDVTIPWIAWGHGVIAGQLPDHAVTTMDTAATVLYLLGINRPANWAGTPITAAFGPQQVADPNFDVSVKQPAYTREQPRVVIDEAHRNFHTADGRYRPLASLLRNDGYDVQPGAAAFTAASLAGTRVLIIANALGAGATTGSDSSPPAFTDVECDAVLAWVTRGGSLLLISDHTPMGEANEGLASRFGVTMGKGYVRSLDARHHLPDQASQLLFSRENGGLGDHPITRGRTAEERINRVVSFTGQSLTVPPGGVALLALGPDAWESPTRSASQLLARDVAAATSMTAFTSTHGTAVPNRAQGVALTVGAGRVVILGEAAMMSAQVFPAADGGQGRMGMNVPGSDDRQFALNVLHWLSRVF